MSTFKSGVIWNLISIGIMASSGLMLNTLLALFGGSSALGIFNQVFAIYIVAAQLAVGGLQFSTLQKVSYSSQNLGLCKTIVLAAIVITTIWSSIIAALLYYYSNAIGYILSSSEVAVGVKYIACGLIFYCINKVLIAAINGMQHMRAYAIFQSLRYIFIIIFLAATLYYHPDNPSIFPLSLTLAELALFVLLISYLVKKYYVFSIYKNEFSKLMLEHLSFSLKGATSGIVTELNTRVDIIMLGYFVTDSLVGIYSFASTIAEGVKQIPAVIRWNVDPILGQQFANKDSSTIIDFVNKVKTLIFKLMTSLCLASLFLYPLLLLILGITDSMWPSYYVFLILLFGVYINSYYSPFLGILLQGKRPGLQSILVIILFISNVIGNLIFIKIFGINGAAIATTITFLLEALLIKVAAQKVFKISI